MQPLVLDGEARLCHERAQQMLVVLREALLYNVTTSDILRVDQAEGGGGGGRLQATMDECL
jgi:hypothetical protein